MLPANVITGFRYSSYTYSAIPNTGHVRTKSMGMLMVSFF